MLLAAALALAAVIGVLVPDGHGRYADSQRRQGLTSGLKDLRLALESYATDHNGDYPAVAGWASTLTKAKSHGLPAGRLPANPWDPSGGPIAIARGAWPAALPRAAAVAGGAAMPAIGQDLGRGHFPGEGLADALTYGTILYDYDPTSQIYVLYAIGKVGDRATVIMTTGNASC